MGDFTTSLRTWLCAAERLPREERRQLLFGLALYTLFLLWIYFNYSFSYAITFTGAQTTGSWESYYAAQLFDSMALIGCVVCWKYVERHLFTTAYFLVTVFLCSTGTLLSCLAAPGIGDFALALVGDGALKGVGSALLTLLVGAAFARRHDERDPMLITAALFLTIVITLGFFALPQEIALFAVLLAPLAIVALVGALQGNDAVERRRSRVSGREIALFVAKMFVMICIFNSVNNISKGIYRFSNATADLGAIAVTAGLVLAVLVISGLTYGRFNVVSLYRTVFLFTLICFLASPIVGERPADANAMVAVTASLFRTFLFICELLFCARTGLPPILVFGIGEVVKRIPNFLTLALVPEFSIDTLLLSETLYITFFLAPAVLLVLVYVLVCTESDLIFLEERDEAPDALELLQAHRLEVARRHGLTERETEVFLLLAVGKSRPRIAEELFLAPSTVNVYSKKIYKKLSVHTRQELIEMANPNHHGV